MVLLGLCRISVVVRTLNESFTFQTLESSSDRAGAETRLLCKVLCGRPRMTVDIVVLYRNPAENGFVRW
jgi:hypothetical protein